MANVSFYVGSSTPGTSGLTAGGLYVDSSGGQLYYATSTTAKKQIGSSMKMMSDKGWTRLNGTTGICIDSLTSTQKTTLSYASMLFCGFKSVPFATIAPNAFDYSGTVSKSFFCIQAPYETGYFKSINCEYCGQWTSSLKGQDVWIYNVYFSLTDEGSNQWSYCYSRTADTAFMNGNTRFMVDGASSYFYIYAYRF